MSLFLNNSEGLKEPNKPLTGNLNLLLAVEKVSGMLEEYKEIKKSLSGFNPTEKESEEFIREIELHSDEIMDIIRDVIIKPLAAAEGDKNKDLTAEECIKVIINNNPPLINEFTPDEEFAPGAFDNDNSDNNIKDDELKSGEDDEDHYSAPLKKVWL
ncbi:hypothetical protein QBC46DRAFT_411038 [Diplogelasinospora grovesii]|uniref:Uncharacterized protein n=1 Tax=Diplogelasinospora grovesii TaxID=303347 RepID=A0AAN6N1V3_9PEZI|nr:hypothetical protein QBC46DRAFT_411038 [Diplogelasinospora grovesii]